jgi:hypothetical protein
MRRTSLCKWDFLRCMDTMQERGDVDENKDGTFDLVEDGTDKD